MKYTEPKYKIPVMMLFKKQNF